MAESCGQNKNPLAGQLAGGGFDLSVLEFDLAQVRPSARGMLIRVPDVIGNPVPTPVPWLIRVIQFKSIRTHGLGQIKFSIALIIKARAMP
jgi:hypothetical protein